MIYKRFTSIRVFFIFMALGLVMAIGAGSAAAARSSKLVVTLDIQGLEALGDGFAYEGWAIVDGQPVSTGTFTIDDNGRFSQTSFIFEARPHQVSDFVLTIEPVPDPDPAPSAVHVLGGSFYGRQASLATSHPAALGTDFSTAAGTYILNAPSGASLGIPYTHGIWWLNPAAGPGPSLTLPTLPSGWIYEGWVVGPNGPISTGTFADPAMIDSDGAGVTAGPDGWPPFPGQDFVNPPQSLVGYTAVISVEPVPDNSPAPFVIKPLVDGTIDDVGAGVPQEMAQNLGSVPSGTARLAKARLYRVTIQNMAAGQPLSPPVVATHRGAASLFAEGSYASPEIEAIAENGDASGAVTLLNGLTAVTSAVNIGQPLTPHGTVVGDFTDTVSVEIYARPGDRLSLASMLICTNDGFAGLDRARLARSRVQSFYAYAFDAGTEANTELSSDIVDGCSALGPAVLHGDPNGNENTAVNTQELITSHPGIVGSGDLLAAHNWHGPIALVTVELLEH